MLKTQKKLINQIQLLGGSLILILGCIDLAMGGLEIGLLKILTCIPFFFGYFYFRNKGNIFPYVHFLLLAALIMITINFFFNGGFMGPTNFAFFLLITLIALLFPKNQRLIWFSGISIVFISLHYIQLYEIFAVKNVYESPDILFFDLVITYLFCGTFILLSINIFLNEFQIRSRELREAKNEIDSKLQEQFKINSQKNNLIGVLAHDLRSPIKSLGQTIELYEKRELESHELDFLLRSLKQQFNAIDLTLENTLDYIKAELKDYDFNKIHTNVLIFSTELLERFMTKAISKSIKLRLDYEESVKNTEYILPINAIDIILRNLLDNALKFSPANSTVMMRIKKRGSNSIEWSVSDEGDGIPQDIQDSFFTKQFKTNPGSQNEKGTGLGIKFCLNLAEKIGGNLSFETKKGKGTTFFVTLPLK